jgi:hypothetical protein
MNNLLVVPSPDTQDANVSIADWAELSALFAADGSTSREDVVRALRRDGTSPLVSEETAQDVFKELADRASCAITSGGAMTYPFTLERNNTYLRLNNFGPNDRWRRGFVYNFLLLVTRASMSSKERVLAGVDPTKIFENLCAAVLQTFWGGASSHSGAMVFGTSAPSASSFKSKVEDLCTKLGEGGGWREGAVVPGGGDGKLDLVAWRKFQDGRQGGLVGFAQCKTGVNWDQHLTKLRPLTFCRKFMKLPLVLEPVRIYMVPNRIGRHVWEEHTGNAGILFDRCRIVQYADGIDKKLLVQAQKWLDEAVEQQKTIMKRVSRRP